MRFIAFLLLGETLASASSPAISCTILSKLYPNSTFLPGSTRYNFENTYSWTATAWLGPACVFCPQSATMVAKAVQLFSLQQTPFAIRSGGAMPVADAANIGPEGILISSTNMTGMSLSNDKQILTVGTGIRWPEVYSFLEPYNVIVNGIRIGNVGVVGFLLGGGIGFFSYEHGLAATGVLSFECILASGAIVTASLSSHPDLFWALRGGGNSFAIVTSVKLYTIPSPIVHLGNVGYGTGDLVKSQYITSIVDFALYAGSDPKSAIEGQIRWAPSSGDLDITYWAFLFHSGNDTNPTGLANLTAPVLPFTYGAITEQTMGEWSDSFTAGFAGDTGFREFFHFFAIPADSLAFRIAHDTYFAAMQPLVSTVGFFTAFSVMPITTNVVAASAVNGGNPLGLSANSVPALWLVESPSWVFAADDAAVLAAHTEANRLIAANLVAAGFVEMPFVYLSDAQKGQSVFNTYGVENLRKLKVIRDRYDPAMVFTKLMPGGAKIALA